MNAWKLVAVLYLILAGLVGLSHCQTQPTVHTFAVPVK